MHTVAYYKANPKKWASERNLLLGRLMGARVALEAVEIIFPFYTAKKELKYLDTIIEGVKDLNNHTRYLDFLKAWGL